MNAVAKIRLPRDIGQVRADDALSDPLTVLAVKRSLGVRVQVGFGFFKEEDWVERQPLALC